MAQRTFSRGCSGSRPVLQARTKRRTLLLRKVLGRSSEPLYCSTCILRPSCSNRSPALIRCFNNRPTLKVNRRKTLFLAVCCHKLFRSVACHLLKFLGQTDLISAVLLWKDEIVRPSEVGHVLYLCPISLPLGAVRTLELIRGFIYTRSMFQFADNMYSQTASTTQSVHLIGSWDNFTRHYPLERDIRRGRGQWRGCYAFEDIICDGDGGSSPKRTGGLKMGSTYYYYVRSFIAETVNKTLMFTYSTNWMTALSTTTRRSHLLLLAHTSQVNLSTFFMYP